MFLSLLFLCIRTGLLFSCTSQVPEAATVLQEEEEEELNPTPLTESQIPRLGKWLRKKTTEQISTCSIFKFGEEREDRPVGLRAAEWHFEATCSTASGSPSLRGRGVIVEPVSA